jgi:L-gulonolactone oxidase
VKSVFVFFIFLSVYLHGEVTDKEREEIRALSIFCEQEKSIDITNGGIRFDHNPTLFHPESNQEIIEIIELAKTYNRKIRVVGSMHSLNPCYLTYDYMIVLDRMNKVLEIGEDYCTVEGGITIRNLCVELEKYGLTMAVLGSIAEQTITGAISTGTRGQVPSQGSLGSLVSHVELIDGMGQVRNLTLENNTDELNAAITSLGLLGVITKVTIKCQPLFLMSEIIRRLPMKDVVEQMDRLLTYEKLVLYWNVDAEEVKVVTGHRVLCDIPSREIAHFTTLGTYPHLHSMEDFPDTLQRIGKSWEIITLLHWTAEKSARRVRNMKLEQEGIFQGDYSVPKEQFISLLDDIRKFFRENRHRLRLSKNRMVVEIRPVKADDVWLSPSYGRDSFSLCFHDFVRGLDWSLEDAKDFIEFEQILKKYDVRPHLGKAHFFSPSDLEKAFPKWLYFKELRKLSDPDNVFLTDYLSQLFCM